MYRTPGYIKIQPRAEPVTYNTGLFQNTDPSHYLASCNHFEIIKYVKTQKILLNCINFYLIDLCVKKFVLKGGEGDSQIDLCTKTISSKGHKEHYKSSIHWWHSMWVCVCLHNIYDITVVFYGCIIDQTTCRDKDLTWLYGLSHTIYNGCQKRII